MVPISAGSRTTWVCSSTGPQTAGTWSSPPVSTWSVRTAPVSRRSLWNASGARPSSPTGAGNGLCGPASGLVRSIPMANLEELERLSSKELHDRAVRLAEHRLDVGFLWRLIKAIPVAEAAAGNLGEAEADVAVADLVPLIHDFIHADEGTLADALRP